MNETLMQQAMAALRAGDLDRASQIFLSEARNAESSGRIADVAIALTAAARLSILANDLDEARRRLDRAEPHARVAGRLAEVERVRAELADRDGDVHVRRRAWTAVHDAGAGPERLYALTQLGSIELAAGNPGEAARLYENALALAGTGDALLRAELTLERAIALTAAGEHDRAGVLLDDVERGLPAEDAGLRARVTGQRGVLALARGDADAALRHAQAARTQAVANSDVMVYLSATSLIVMVHENAGRLLDAYDAMVRAKVSLLDLLGAEGEGLVQPAIDLFAERIGTERYEAIREEWIRTRRAAKGP